MALDNKGKSPIFKALSKKFAEEIQKKKNAESKPKVEEVKEEIKGTDIKVPEKVKPGEELVKKEGEAKVEEEKARKPLVESNGEERKRKKSGESNDGEKDSK